MTEHTPGPWHVDAGTHPGIDAEPPFTIVLFGDAGEDCGIKGTTPEQAVANAHLIAAAPDLYTEGNQSAVTMREAAKVFRGMDMNTMGMIMDAQAEKQEAAIARAKGQTP